MTTSQQYFVLVKIKRKSVRYDNIVSSIDEATALMADGFNLIGFASDYKSGFKFVVDYVNENNLRYEGWKR